MPKIRFKIIFNTDRFLNEFRPNLVQLQKGNKEITELYLSWAKSRLETVGKDPAQDPETAALEMLLKVERTCQQDRDGGPGSARHARDAKSNGRGINKATGQRWTGSKQDIEDFCMLSIKINII